MTTMSNARALTTRILLLLAVAAVAATATQSSARANDGHGPKVDRAVANQVDIDRKTEIDVILRGPDTNKLFIKYGAGGIKLPVIGGVATTVLAKDLERLAADPDVDFVLADPPAAPQGPGIDYSQLTTIYPLASRANVAWKKGYTGEGVGIAVIDSGVSPKADFGARVVKVTLPSLARSTDDEVGHGSLVAGIAAGSSPDGKFIGVAPEATIYALNVNGRRGVRTSDVLDALQWVFDNAGAHNIRVVNLSLGQTVESSYQTSLLDLAVERLWAAGVTVVVAAGNGGDGAVNFAPANDPLVISVGATDTRGTVDAADDVVTYFSASGTTMDGFAKPELVAPGKLIASVLPVGTTLDLQAPAANRVAPGYAAISGTSFSAPQVAGAAAILHQRHPQWSPDQVKGALVAASRPISGSTKRTLDIGAAIDMNNPPRANQGVPALVCAPGSTCLPDTGQNRIASSWNSSSWNASSWNSSSWNASSWNSSSWNASSWNASSWNGSSWNASSWNNASWYYFDGAPTAVTLRSVTARRSARGVLLRWQTGSELDLLGFNVYRLQRGKLVKVNRTLVARIFSGTTGGHGYSFRDRHNPIAAVKYRLQAVKVDGSRSWLGPAVAPRS